MHADTLISPTNADILAEDIAHIHTALLPWWPALAGARLFVTGGTGFIGKWLLASLAHADAALGLGVEVSLLSRDPAGFAARNPALAAWPALRMVAGDVCALRPDGQRYTHVIHAATEASAALNENDPRAMFDTVVEGTRRALDFAVAAGAGRFLYLSSGAVYGAQGEPHVSETATTGPDPTFYRNAYAEGKRAAEMLCAIYGRQFGLPVVTARIFALLGPLLPLDIHFAAGNFLADALAGRPVVVNSCGRAERSYLYAADMAEWLWAMLLRASPGAVYNVGAQEAVSIAELARRIAALVGTGEWRVLGAPDAGWNPGRYVPSTRRIAADLGLAPRIGLDEAICRTALWHGWNR